ncbi:hypothetical protein A3SI_13257 [Nitritalea halalkaliphila LW7]|uniref:Uncharacterized protein n=1 Tax=Nitritalea halalkaliphila LW7 TaxID=1189621 RepID=I5C0M7_9BACT|nr:hypothetical protein A3SI_13257 [Nitritalea halalkaliphila LW7]
MSVFIREKEAEREGLPAAKRTLAQAEKAKRKRGKGSRHRQPRPSGIAEGAGYCGGFPSWA